MKDPKRKSINWLERQLQLVYQIEIDSRHRLDIDSRHRLDIDSRHRLVIDSRHRLVICCFLLLILIK